MLLLNVSRKPYLEILMAPSRLNLSDLERSSQDHPFEVLYLVKAAELGNVSLLNTNTKAYEGSLMALSDLTLSDLER